MPSQAATHPKVMPEGMRDRLRDIILTKIDEYLDGKTPGPDIATWAASLLAQYTIPSTSFVLDCALRALVAAGQTTPQDVGPKLMEIKAALQGASSLVVTLGPSGSA